MDIDATDFVTVRRDDLLAMESEIKGLTEQLDAALRLGHDANAIIGEQRERINRTSEYVNRYGAINKHYLLRVLRGEA